jgi:hypothetical protein
LQVLSAFCDILGATPADLVTTIAENAGVRGTATDDQPAPMSLVFQSSFGPSAGHWCTKPVSADWPLHWGPSQPGHCPWTAIGAISSASAGTIAAIEVFTT